MILLLNGNRGDLGLRRRSRFVRRVTYPAIDFGWADWFVAYTVYGSDGAMLETGHIFWGRREVFVADGRIRIWCDSSPWSWWGASRDCIYRAELVDDDDDST